MIPLLLLSLTVSAGDAPRVKAWPVNTIFVNEERVQAPPRAAVTIIDWGEFDIYLESTSGMGHPGYALAMSGPNVTYFIQKITDGPVTWIEYADTIPVAEHVCDNGRTDPQVCAGFYGTCNILIDFPKDDRP